MELGAHAVRAALERCPGLEPDYVAVGNVLQAANGQNPGRRAALAGGVRRDVPGITLNDVCLASMSAVALGVAMLRAEEAGVVLVGGFDSMTRAPHAVRMRPAVKAGRPAADRRDGPRRPLLLDRRRRHGRDVGRREPAARGQPRGAGPLRRRARTSAPAAAEARLAEEIVPLAGLEHDEGIRPQTTYETLADAPARLRRATARSPPATPARCPTGPPRR